MKLPWRRTPCTTCHQQPATHDTLCATCHHYALTLHYYPTARKRAI